MHIPDLNDICQGLTDTINDLVEEGISVTMPGSSTPITSVVGVYAFYRPLDDPPGVVFIALPVSEDSEDEKGLT